MKSIMSKFGLILGGFLFFMCIIVGVTLLGIRSQKNDGNIINLAGRQRMLSQKMTRAALGISTGSRVSNYKQILATSSMLFDKTLKALLDGGELKSGHGETIKIVGAESGSIRNQLQRVGAIWRPFYSHVKILMNNNPDNSEFVSSLSYIEKNSDLLLAEMNRAVGLYEDASARKIRNMQIFQQIFLIAGIFLVIAGLQLVRKLIVKPVREVATFSESLARNEIANLGEGIRRMAQGDLNASIQTVTTPWQYAGNDELAGMAKNLNYILEETQTTVKDFQTTQSILKRLIKELREFAIHARQGKLSVRADISSFTGAYQDLIANLNEAVDSMLNPIEEAAEILRHFAERDLTRYMNGDYSGDHAKLKRALNKAIDNLNQALQRVASGSEQISIAAGEIASQSNSLAQGASTQASSLEEISSSLNEMASLTRQNSSNAQEAKRVVEATHSSTTKGMDSMNRLSDAINRIKVSSDNTAQIIQTIDDIAFQTNLLALNAAVEAARAGEAGKGFAVVAEEVRNLAMRSAEAAKNTTEMIAESVRNAENGVEINHEALSNLNEINELVNKVNAVMTEIADASEQQKLGIEQITAAIDHVNQVTQANAASSEESASASEELSSQSKEMREMVNSFKLNDAVNEVLTEQENIDLSF